MSDKTIVRLSEGYYVRGDTFVKAKTLRRLKSLSSDISLHSFGCDVSELFGDIVNIDECKPGLYELKIVNISRDYETGYADDWDLMLVPYESITNER